ncbi:MAG: Wzt carbohydrate-binding domain-containing protein [Deltaproteobacteria bacterium]|nr:Wzt carbohydrate-binding domain-containing protein [Deltaproteobacteria bacterium]
MLKSYRKIEEIRKRGIPVLLVSHNLQLIRNFCTSAIWLHEGQIRAQGTPNDVCAAYTRHALDTAAGELALTSSDSYRVQSDPSISLESVRFVAPDGSERADFESGGDMTIEMTIAASRATGPLLVNVTVWQAESGQMLLCQNNVDDGTPYRGIEAPGRAKALMRFPRLPFVAGLHQVSVSVSEHNVNNVCDWHEKRFSFKVVGWRGRLRVLPGVSRLGVCGLTRAHLLRRRPLAQLRDSWIAAVVRQPLPLAARPRA